MCLEHGLFLPPCKDFCEGTEKWAQQSGWTRAAVGVLSRPTAGRRRTSAPSDGALPQRCPVFVRLLVLHSPLHPSSVLVPVWPRPPPFQELHFNQTRAAISLPTHPVTVLFGPHKMPSPIFAYWEAVYLLRANSRSFFSMKSAQISPASGHIFPSCRICCANCTAYS